MPKKESVEETSDAVVAEEVKEIKPVKIRDDISLEKYFDVYSNSVHPYTRAFVSVNYRGILKTKEEWDEEMKGKF